MDDIHLQCSKCHNDESESELVFVAVWVENTDTKWSNMKPAAK